MPSYILLNSFKINSLRCVFYYYYALLQFFLYVGDTSPCAEEELPVPKNSSITCEILQGGLDLLCILRCNPMFTFESSEDNSLQTQYCRNGIWDFQQMGKEIPDCQREHTHVSFLST